MERAFIWIPEGRVKESGHQLCDPVPLKFSKKPIRLWSLTRFRNKAIKPPSRIPLVHRETGILEDITHDWSIRQGHLVYRGQFAEGGVWVALEFED